MQDTNRTQKLKKKQSHSSYKQNATHIQDLTHLLLKPLVRNI